MIANKYDVIGIIGKGSFGIVYKAINPKKNELVAIKIENKNTPFKLLKHETTMLKYLCENGCHNIPIVHWYGTELNKTVMVMTYYDCNLIDFYKESKDNSIIDKMMVCFIKIMAKIHKKFVIHRDIKPQNFMIKDGDIFLIDFGLSIFYVDENRNHILDTRIHSEIIGSPRYASYYIHNGNTPSRRDDMISLGYMYLFLNNGELEWDKLTENCSTNHTDIMCNSNKERKGLKSWEVLGKMVSIINTKIWNYLNYCYSLNYDDEPNYKSLCDFFI